ncbi:hypothetical protein HS088_TW15G00100 [Tripterygium wilfordii]|uniref:Imidazoleglycerol-phosphate dehydratase n=1 Tax=Tripterygium wilfordii TaxID=458696 RepID=A0A7J7CKN7_TRIWF|nr:hypothetical protein HS088_TW15G00100 [Tripterygium wilfordii]
MTRETNVSVKINLDGSGVTDSRTGIPFLDHMLDALLKALGDRKGINRFGDFSAPLDEALIHVSLIYAVMKQQCGLPSLVAQLCQIDSYRLQSMTWTMI